MTPSTAITTSNIVMLPTTTTRLETKDDASLSSHSSTIVDQKGASDGNIDVKSISSNNTASTLVDSATHAFPAKPMAVDAEKAQRRHIAPSIRPTRLHQEKRCSFVTCLLAVAILATWILSNAIFSIFTYYSWYSDTFFNSKVSVHIHRTVLTENVFTVFKWFFTLVALVCNALFSFIAFALAQVIAEDCLKLPKFFKVLWMASWTVVCLGFTVACFWVPGITNDLYQTRIFDHGCANRGWDLDIALHAQPFDPTNSNNTLYAGFASISWTAHPNDTNYIVQLVRHVDNPLRFDLLPFAFTSGSFSNITYDWQNATYTAFRPDSTNVTGTFLVNPNLVIPSLNVSTLDDSIPFQRPDYKHCWPATATLITQNSTTLGSAKVLETLTSSSWDDTLVKVCAMAGPDVAAKMQISLGVVFIDHFYYSLCKLR